MKLPDYVVVAVALCRARESGHEIMDRDVLTECEGWGVDPEPVMILVQGKAPCRRYARYPLPDGTTLTSPVPGDRFVPITFGAVYTNTVEMNEALALRRGAMDLED